MKTEQELTAQCDRIEEILGMNDIAAKDDQERTEAFQHAIKKLRAIQHEIDDVATVAALELNRLRSRYNYWLDLYKPFLKAYALEKAEVNKQTGEKVKHYRDRTVGGGVFFTARTISTKFTDQTKLKEAVGLIEDAQNNGGDPDLADYDIKYPSRNLFKTVEVVEVLDGALFVEALKALDVDPIEYGIVEGSTDALGHMYIGTERGWTPNKMKEKLGKALDGELPIVVE